MLPELDEIKRKRRKLGLKQIELAKLSGVSQSLIAKIESKKINPSYTYTKEIFDALERLEEKEQIIAKDIMTQEVIGIEKGEKLSKAVKIMEKRGISQLPVFDKNVPIGSISEETIMNMIGRGGDVAKFSEFPIKEIMDEGFPQIDEKMPAAVISSLLKHNSAVLVVKKGKVIGIITKADLLKIVHNV